METQKPGGMFALNRLILENLAMNELARSLRLAGEVRPSGHVVVGFLPAITAIGVQSFSINGTVVPGAGRCNAP